jgi:hypothetical protein
MAFVEPSKGRAKIIDLGDTLRIEIPAHPGGFIGWVYLLFLTGFLIGWAVGELFALRELGLLPRPEGWMTQGSSFSVEWLIGWLIVWTVGGILAGCLWLSVLLMLVGREVIMVSPMSLDIVIRPIGYVRRYRLTEISNLRVEEERREFTEEGVSSTVGVIVFDYGVSTVRFGLWLEPAEARQIVALLKERFGQYMADGEAGGMKDEVFVEPYKPRARIAETGNAIQIEIPFRPKGFMTRLVWLLFTSFLLGSWCAVFILRQFIKAPIQDKPPSLFTAIFTVVWLFFILVFSGVWWQMTFGREIITVTPQELTFWQQPFGQRRRFHLAEVKNLRVLEDTFSVSCPYAKGYPLFVVTFDYGAGTVRFGTNLDPAEARQIVALLKERFGQYMADGKVEAGS